MKMMFKSGSTNTNVWSGNVRKEDGWDSHARFYGNWRFSEIVLSDQVEKMEEWGSETESWREKKMSERVDRKVSK